MMFLLLIAATALLSCTRDEGGSGGPVVDHVLLISIDSLRSDHLGVYGYDKPTSPVIDSLASHGLVFDRAYSTTSWTLPAHIALLTGLDDGAHGVVSDKLAMPTGLTSLAEAVQSAGVEAVGFFSGPYLSPIFGFDRGFDEYIDCTGFAGKEEGKTGRRRVHEESHRDVTNPILLERVGTWLDEWTGRKQGFFFLHMWDVHYDYLAPQRYVEIFDPDYQGSLSGRGFQSNNRIRPGMPRRDLEHLLALYDAEIRYTDETLGKVLEMFREKGLLERTAIIVLSDHGDEFLEHGRKGHRLTLFEEVLRVPLVIVVPGLDPVDPRIETVVSIVDVYPTVCELLDLPYPAARSGESLLSFFRNGDLENARGDALSELTWPELDLAEIALVRANDKVIHWKKENYFAYFEGETMRNEQGGVILSPRGRANWPKQAEDAIEQLGRRVEMARELREEVLNITPQIAPPFRKEMEEHLRSLGYVQ